LGVEQKLAELKDKRAESRAGGSAAVRAHTGAAMAKGDMGLEEWKSEHKLTGELPVRGVDTGSAGVGATPAPPPGRARGFILDSMSSVKSSA
jgi:hypothetical protein